LQKILKGTYTQVRKKDSHKHKSCGRKNFTKGIDEQMGNWKQSNMSNSVNQQIPVILLEKTNKITGISKYLSTITLNINGLNSLLKDRLAGWIKNIRSSYLSI
jgi:hypothetical protein